MNPWGFLIAFTGYIMVYVGIKGTQSSVVQAFSKKG